MFAVWGHCFKGRKRPEMGRFGSLEGDAEVPTLFGNIDSGNVHKAQMILRRVGKPCRRVEVAQTHAKPTHGRFLELNPIGKMPVVT